MRSARPARTAHGTAFRRACHPIHDEPVRSGGPCRRTHTGGAGRTAFGDLSRKRFLKPWRACCPDTQNAGSEGVCDNASDFACRFNFNTSIFSIDCRPTSTTKEPSYPRIILHFIATCLNFLKITTF